MMVREDLDQTAALGKAVGYDVSQFTRHARRDTPMILEETLVTLIATPDHRMGNRALSRCTLTTPIR